MASLDFDLEKQEFRDFYADNFDILEDAKTSFCALINALVSHGDNIAISKIDGRVKDKEECIRKFNLGVIGDRPRFKRAGTIVCH